MTTAISEFNGVTDVTDVTSVCMADLNIRNLDASLVRELKVRAAQSDKTLRDYVIGVLWSAVGEKSHEPEKIERKPKSTKMGRNERYEVGTVPDVRKLGTDEQDRAEAGPAAKNSSQPRNGIESAPNCPRCDKRMIEWGPQFWRCAEHGNFPK